MTIDQARERAEEIQESIGKVIVGKKTVIELLLTAIIAGGHVLLEDVPGTGKTVLAKSLAKSVDAQFGRVQFTPDLLPSDVTGLNYFDAKKGEFKFLEGPVFCNILLADEINRATPKTQSSLLECMAEHQVTVDGVTRKLAEPFFVIATQNPVETTGTFPLPEAQMDRFMMRLSMGLPDRAEELAILENVGNLVCPTDFDLGENAKVMILSVPEGDDKPLKYPLMFSVCDVVLGNKIDALPYFDFDLEKCREYVHRRNPQARVIPVCAKTGEGIQEWTDWLSEQVRDWNGL